jgi:hypothetical protein
MCGTGLVMSYLSFLVLTGKMGDRLGHHEAILSPTTIIAGSTRMVARSTRSNIRKAMTPKALNMPILLKAIIPKPEAVVVPATSRATPVRSRLTSRALPTGRPALLSYR